MQRKFDDIPNDPKKKCIAEVISRIEEIESDQVGVIAVQEIIDIVLQNLGPEIYNFALEDVKRLVQAKASDLEYEVELLRQE